MKFYLMKTNLFSKIYINLCKLLTSYSNKPGDLPNDTSQLVSLAMDASTLGIWRHDIENDRIFLDERAKKFYGFNKSVLRMAEIFTHVHPEDITRLSEEMEKVINPAGNGKIQTEYRVVHPDGSVHWLDIHTRIDFSGEGTERKPVFGYGTVDDITERKLTEIRLEETRFGIDHAQIGIFQIEEDGLISYVNQYAADSLGYTREELKDMTIFQIDPNFNPENFPAHRAEIRISGSRTLFSTHQRKDGSVFPVEITINYFLFRDQLKSFSFVKDISDRVNAEKKLKQSRDLLQYVIEHSNGAVAILDRDLKYIYVSEKYLNDYGIKEKDIVGKHHYEVFPEIPENWKEVHQKALAGEISSSVRDPFYREDGSLEWTRWECRPWYEQEGFIGGIILYTEAITDQVKTEQILKESELRFRLLAESAPLGIVISDMNEKTIYINDRFREMFGYSIKEMPSVNEWWVLAYPDPDLRERAKSEWKVLMEQSGKNRSGTKPMEFPVTCSDGKVKIIEFSVASIREHNYVLLSDVTERRTAERALQQLKDQLEQQVEEKTQELKERIRELERFREATIDREFRIKELRDEIAGLKNDRQENSAYLM